MIRPFRPPKPLSPREQAKAIRRLNVEFGVGPTVDVKGLLLGVAIAAILGMGVVAYTLPLGPATAIQGRIVSIGLSGHTLSAASTAVVDTGGARNVVRAPAGVRCAVGDLIALTRQRRPLGVRYEIAPQGCTSPLTVR